MIHSIRFFTKIPPQRYYVAYACDGRLMRFNYNLEYVVSERNYKGISKYWQQMKHAQNLKPDLNDISYRI
jgi:hypothetical protein